MARKSAKCTRCRNLIYPRKSKSTGRTSLQSGIRKHYWDKHRRVMMRGAKRQRKNPCRTSNKCRSKNPQFRYFDRKKYTLVSNHRTKAAANKKAKATRGRKYWGGAIHTVRARATKGGPSGWQVWKHVKNPRRRR